MKKSPAKKVAEAPESNGNGKEENGSEEAAEDAPAENGDAEESNDATENGDATGKHVPHIYFSYILQLFLLLTLIKFFNGFHNSQTFVLQKRKKLP